MFCTSADGVRQCDINNHWAAAPLYFKMCVLNSKSDLSGSRGRLSLLIIKVNVAQSIAKTAAQTANEIIYRET